MRTFRHPGDMLVVSIGEILWDVIGNQRHMGGAPLNFACHARAAGAQAALISRVSSDDLGADLVRRAGEMGIDALAIRKDAAHQTGVVTAEVNAEGETRYVFADDCAWDHLVFSDYEREMLDRAGIIYFGTLAQRHPQNHVNIMAALAGVTHDCMKFVDLNLREPFFSTDVIRQSLQMATVAKMNGAELEVVKQLFGHAGEDDESAVLHLLGQFGLETIVVTRGAEGASAWNGDEAAHVAARRVNVVDTVGCGDGFAAVFAVKLACGAPLDEALEAATVAGSYLATMAGGTPVYTADDIRRFRADTAEPRGMLDSLSR